MGFINMPNGSFYDPEGVYFDQEGYNKFGGYYDYDSNYFPGSEEPKHKSKSKSKSK